MQQYICPSCHQAVAPQIIKRLSGVGVAVLLIGLLFCLVGALFSLFFIEEHTVCPICGYRVGQILRSGVIPATQQPIIPPVPSKPWTPSEKRLLAICGGIALITIVAAFIYASVSQELARKPIDRLAPLTAQQQAAIQTVLNYTDQLDAIYDQRAKTRLTPDLYHAKLEDTNEEYYRAYGVLPKNDARMMMSNMMEGYTNTGILLSSKQVDPTPTMAAARLRKEFLKDILAGNLKPEEKKMLETLRQQDQ
jgi:hypothetical protein